MGRTVNIDHSRLDAVNAMHSGVALRLLAAQDGLERKSIRAAFAVPAGRCSDIECVVGGLLGSAPSPNPSKKAVLSAEEEQALESELECQVQRILGIMAILINQQEADIGNMNSLLELIGLLDRDFFLFAGKDIEDVFTGRAPISVLMNAIERYLEKTA